MAQTDLSGIELSHHSLSGIRPIRTQARSTKNPEIKPTVRILNMEMSSIRQAEVILRRCLSCQRVLRGSNNSGDLSPERQGRKIDEFPSISLLCKGNAPNEKSGNLGFNGSRRFFS
jgi:hypothetical protein